MRFISTLKKTALGLAWFALSLVAILCALLIAAILLARTDAGHRIVLRMALPHLQERFVGKLRVQSLSGDLTHTLTLHGIALQDPEGELALRIKKLTVRYSLVELTKAVLHIESIDLQDGLVLARHLQTGQLNLRALRKPGAPGGKHLTVKIDRAHADGDLSFDSDDETPSRHLRAHAVLSLSDILADGRLKGTISALQLSTVSPMVAHTELRGAFDYRESLAELIDVHLDVQTTGRELNRVVPRANFQGDWRMRAYTDGDLRNLTVRAAILPPRGSIRIAGAVGAGLGGISWRGNLDMVGVDPAVCWFGAPQGNVRAKASAHGINRKGVLDLNEIVANLTGMQGQASGRFELGTMFAASASFMLRVADLSRLATLGIPGLSGELNLRGRLARLPGHLHIDAEAQGRDIALGAARVHLLNARVHSLDLAGEARLHAKGVIIPSLQDGRRRGLHLDTVALSATGTRRKIALTIEGSGPGRSHFVVDSHGIPLGGRGISGVDMVLERVSAAVRGESWQSIRPGHVRIDHRQCFIELALGSREQRLELVGGYQLHTQAVALTLSGSGLDLVRIGQLLRPELDLPRSRLQLQLTLRGTPAQPRLSFAIDGPTEAQPERQVERLDWHAAGRYEAGRLRVNGTASGHTQRLSAAFDVPIALPSHASLTGTFDLHHFRIDPLGELLPWSFGLTGLFDLEVRLGGTRGSPTLQARLEVPEWQVQGLGHNRLRFEVNYARRRLSAHLATHLESAARRPAGSLDLSLAAPIDLASKRALLDRLERSPVQFSARVSELDVRALPWKLFTSRTPVTAGIFSGDFTLLGTLAQPTFHGEVQGRKISGRFGEALDLAVLLSYVRDRLRVEATLGAHEKPLVMARGTSPVHLLNLIRGGDWRAVPLEAHVSVARYNLAYLPPLGGTLRGELAFQGTWGAPSCSGSLTAEPFAIGKTRVEQVSLQGGFEQRGLSIGLRARLHGLDVATLQAKLPRARDAPLTISAHVHNLPLTLDDLGPLHRGQGRLNANLSVSGTRAHPLLAGSLRVRSGSLTVWENPHPLQSVELDMAVQDGAIIFRQLRAQSGGGHLEASARLELDGLRPDKLDGRVKIDRLPWMQGSVEGFLDAVAQIQGQQTPNGFSGTITVEKGSFTLPKLAAGRSLQPTGSLEDVVYVDRAALRRAAARARAEEGNSPALAHVATKVPGPFHIRSKDLDADLKGDLRIEITGPIAKLFGTVESTWGRIELLNRRYALVKAHVFFDGAPRVNPQLDIEARRELGNTVLTIKVQGTARKPNLLLSCDPPIYDQSELVGLILSGDPGNPNVPDRSLNQVAGAISGIVVNKIKSQIAIGLPIDVIQVTPGVSGYAGPGTSRIEIGKYFTDNIYLSYVHQFGTPIGLRRYNSNQAQLEYRFKRNFEVFGMFGDAGAGSLDFYWTLRY